MGTEEAQCSVVPVGYVSHKGMPACSSPRIGQEAAGGSRKDKKKQKKKRKRSHREASPSQTPDPGPASLTEHKRHRCASQEAAQPVLAAGFCSAFHGLLTLHISHVSLVVTPRLSKPSIQDNS